MTYGISDRGDHPGTLPATNDVVIATKVYAAMTHGPNALGLSRKAIFKAIDASVK